MLDRAVSVRVAQFGPIRMRRRRRHPLVGPRVNQIDEPIHRLREIEIQNLTAPSFALAAGVADAADLVHPVVRNPLVPKDARVGALVLEIAVRHPLGMLRLPDVVVHLVCDVDLRDERGLVGVRGEQHVLAVLHHDGIPGAGSRIVGENTAKNRLPSRPVFRPGA